MNRHFALFLASFALACALVPAASAQTEAGRGQLYLPPKHCPPHALDCDWPRRKPPKAADAGQPAGSKRGGSSTDLRQCIVGPTWATSRGSTKGTSYEIRNACQVPIDAYLCIRTNRGKWWCEITRDVPRGGAAHVSALSGTGEGNWQIQPSSLNHKFRKPE